MQLTKSKRPNANVLIKILIRYIYICVAVLKKRYTKIGWHWANALETKQNWFVA